jgi:hypothetical protein
VEFEKRSTDRIHRKSRWPLAFMRPWKGSQKSTPVPITSHAIETSEDPAVRQKTSLADIRDEFAPIFASYTHQPEPLAQFLSSVNLPDFSDLDFDIDESDIEGAIKTANLQSSSGPDGISFAFIKRYKGIMVPLIYNIYMDLKAGKTHRKLLDSRLTMLKKPGFAGNPKTSGFLGCFLGYFLGGFMGVWWGVWIDCWWGGRCVTCGVGGRLVG